MSRTNPVYLMDQAYPTNLVCQGSPTDWAHPMSRAYLMKQVHPVSQAYPLRPAYPTRPVNPAVRKRRPPRPVLRDPIRTLCPLQYW